MNTISNGTAYCIVLNLGYFNCIISLYKLAWFDYYEKKISLY